MTWQRWGSPGHRSSPSGNGVDALTELTRLYLGSLRATACEVAHVRSDALVRELRCLELPLTPPSSYPGALPAPGAGLPPASPRVSTACYRTPFEG